MAKVSAIIPLFNNRKFILCLVCLILSCVLSGCSSIKPISAEQAGKIDMFQYVPRSGSVIVSRTYGNTGGYLQDTCRYNSLPGNQAERILTENRTLVFSNIDKSTTIDLTWRINQNEIIRKGPYGAGLVCLKTAPTWEVPSTGFFDNISEKYYITNTGLTIETKLGKISNCIEVTVEETEKKWYFLWLTGTKTVTKEYWAPSLGMIRNHVILKIHFLEDVDISSSEVVSYQGPSLHPLNSDSANIVSARQGQMQAANAQLSQEDTIISGLRLLANIEDAKMVFGDSPRVSPLYLNDGPPPSNGEKPMAAGDIYEWQGVTIICNKDPKIIDIRVSRLDIQTSRGIKVGDTYAQMISKYGPPAHSYKHNDMRSYTYDFNKSSIRTERLVFWTKDKDNRILNISISVMPFYPPPI